MQLPAGRTALGSGRGQGKVFSLLLFAALMISSLTDRAAASGRPKILLPANNTINTKEGYSLDILCKAQTKWVKLHNIYWLVNNTFVEDTYPDGRVTEERRGAVAVNGTVAQTLRFWRVLPEDFRKTFTCVVQDPSGVAIKHYNLQQELDGSGEGGLPGIIVTREDPGLR